MNTSNPRPSEAEELNLNLLLAALRRRWRFLLFGVVLGGLLSAWQTSRTKPIWEGSFEIVVSSGGGGSAAGGLSGSNPLLANLAGLASGGKGSALETQVKILQSPSVLRPVFEQVRSRKSASGTDISGYDFQDWINNLTVKLENGTSVLAISYRDTQKSLIVPILLDISKTYQTYSSQERNESLKNGLNYAEEQTRIYRQRSNASFRALNSFGMTYGISGGGGGGGGGGVDISKLLSTKSSGFSGSVLNISGGGGPTFQSKGDSLSQLAGLNQELIRRQQTYTAKDPSVIALRKERDALRRYIETSAIGNIAYPGAKTISKEQAQSVLLRYQELEREANRDQSTLESMESTLLSLQLEQARTTKPWELISTPTVLEQPVAPRPSRTLAIGLASGLVLGACAGLLADRMSGKIFNKDSISSQLPCPLLADLTNAEQKDWHDTLHLLRKHYFPGENLAILPLGELNAATSNKLINGFNKIGSTNAKLCRSISDAEASNQILIVAECGSVSDRDIACLVDRLKLQPNLIAGWIWVAQHENAS